MPSVSAPTDPRYTFVGSDFGPRPSRSGGQDFHPGLDFNVRERDDGQSVETQGMRGMPVYSIADGTVVYTAAERPAPGASLYTNGYGNCVLIRHDQWTDGPEGSPWYSLYAHLLDMRVRTGQRVNVGEQVARVGATSNDLYEGMGAHLHFEIRCKSVTVNRFTNTNDPIPGTNDSAYLDWQVGRRTFQTRRRPSGTTVDPIWWFEQRGLRILRRGETVGTEERRKGTILGGSGPLGTAMLPRGRVSNYQVASLPSGASYGSASARYGLGALHQVRLSPPVALGSHVPSHLGAVPPDSVTITSSTGQQQVLVADTSDLPYQPPVTGRLENPLIPVTDPEAQTPPPGAVIAGIAAVGAIGALGLALTVADSIRR